MPTSSRNTRPASATSLRDLRIHERRNTPHPSKEFLIHRQPKRSSSEERMLALYNTRESFYQDYISGDSGDMGHRIPESINSKPPLPSEYYLGNALYNLAHDPAAPMKMDKKDIVRSISRSFSRIQPASRPISANEHSEMLSANLIDNEKKVIPRPKSITNLPGTRRSLSAIPTFSEIKRYIESSNAKQRKELLQFIGDNRTSEQKNTEKNGKEETNKQADNDKENKSVLDKDKIHNKTKSQKQNKIQQEGKSVQKEFEPKKSDSNPKVTAESLAHKPARLSYQSAHYRKMRAREAQQATGTIFQVSGGRQPQHFTVFPDWPSEKAKPKY